MQHVCQYCNTPFDSPHRKAKFCCRDCADKGRFRVKADRTCRLCSTPLETPGQIKLCYCSKECRDSDPQRTIIDGVVHTTCLKCGNHFTHERWRTNDYCSKECADASRRTVSVVKGECENCHESFKYRDNEPRRFCSRECWYEYGTGENNPHWNSIEIKCEYCKKTIVRQAHRFTSNKHHFCSAKCNGDFYSTIRVGEDHPLYKGIKQHYRGPNWVRQRNKARKRDGYKCQCCGRSEKQLGHTLAVHHIVPFSEFGYIRGVNDNYKKANALTNLVSVCRKCHMPAEYGKVPIQPYLI